MTQTTSARYAAFAERVLATGVLSDPWLDGAPRFSEDPVLLTEDALAEVSHAAEELAFAVDRAVRVLADRPDLLSAFFDVSREERAMATVSWPLWHGIARADFFKTSDGWKATEINCDTPTGEPEAVLLSALASGGRDPNAELRDRWIDMVLALSAPVVDAGGPRRAAILYPTEMTEDLALVRLYAAWLESAGFEVVTGSPLNVTGGESGVHVFGQRVSLVVRHYKADWWAARRPVWEDEPPPPDAAPLGRELRVLLEAEVAGTVAVVNPFGACLAQNKRMLAFLWEAQDLLGERAARAVRAHLPETLRLDVVPLERLSVDRAAWVLKSDYGAEGEEVVVGSRTPDRKWRRALLLAVPTRFVAQRAFSPASNADGEATNLGVFLVAGRASGVFPRLERFPNDRHARTSGVRVLP